MLAHEKFMAGLTLNVVKLTKLVMVGKGKVANEVGGLVGIKDGETEGA